MAGLFFAPFLSSFTIFKPPEAAKPLWGNTKLALILDK